MQRCINAISPLNPGVDVIFSVVLRCISEVFLNVCDEAQNQVDSINLERGNGARFNNEQTKLRLENLAKVVGRCTYLKRSLDPKALMLQSFITRNLPNYLINSSDDIKDSASLFVSMSASVQGFIIHLDSVQANYLAMINLQVSEQSHTVNLLMEKLQNVSSIFLPLTLVSGIMGMNVPIPGSEINAGDDTYFWCLLVAFVVIALVSMVWLNHNRKALQIELQEAHSEKDKALKEQAMLVAAKVSQARRASIATVQAVKVLPNQLMYAQPASHSQANANLR
jgi:Mg2+ and Co2+ transporter CorA